MCEAFPALVVTSGKPFSEEREGALVGEFGRRFVVSIGAMMIGEGVTDIGIDIRSHIRVAFDGFVDIGQQIGRRRVIAFTEMQDQRLGYLGPSGRKFWMRVP